MLQKQWEQDISASFRRARNVVWAGCNKEHTSQLSNSQLLQKSEKSVEKNFGESVNEDEKGI